jgi:hypothetical protein
MAWNWTRRDARVSSFYIESVNIQLKEKRDLEGWRDDRAVCYLGSGDCIDTAGGMLAGGK